MTTSSADRPGEAPGLPASTGDGRLVHAFPPPPQRIRAAFSELLEKSLSVPADELMRVAALPRPWNLAECHGTDRDDLWTWLDQVAAWVNRDHLWTIAQPGIPSCWPRHPHLAHGLAVLAATRYLAALALAPVAIENWQRVTLPGFLERMYAQLDDGCSSGHPQTRPRERRDLEFDQAREARLRLFDEDAAAELRAAGPSDR